MSIEHIYTQYVRILPVKCDPKNRSIGRAVCIRVESLSLNFRMEFTQLMYTALPNTWRPVCMLIYLSLWIFFLFRLLIGFLSASPIVKQKPFTVKYAHIHSRAHTHTLIVISNVKPQADRAHLHRTLTITIRTHAPLIKMVTLLNEKSSKLNRKSTRTTERKNARTKQQQKIIIC